MKIGAQLYTCNAHTQNLNDFELTLEKVSKIGYKSVQVSGTCPYEPEWLRDKLQQYGLICAMTHIAPTRIVNETEEVVKQHAIFGCKHIGIGGMPGEMRNTLEGYNEFKKMFLPVAKKMRDLGAKLLYHNHEFEFDKLAGKDVIERILEDFPEDSIDFTLDLGWAAYAGKDVVKLIKLLNGRLSRIHLKDWVDSPKDGSIPTDPYLRPIYEGKLDYDAYIDALSTAGCEYMLVEQDWCYDEDEFDCLKRSFDNVVRRFPNVK